MSPNTEAETIRQLNEDDFETLFSQQSRAYPTFFRAGGDQLARIREAVKKSLSRPGVTWYGLFEDKRLAGSMRLHDYTVNFRGTPVASGGVGGVAVDLVDKKKQLAKRLMEFYIDHYLASDAPFGLLWPFRPDFYRRMGFGYGGRVYRYTVSPDALPDSELRSQVRTLSGNDLTALADCYHRYAATVTGTVLEREQACPKFIADAVEQERVVGYESDNRLDGFLIYQFGEKEKANFLQYDLLVTRLVYTTSASLAGLAGFLRAQADQVRSVILDIPDDSLHYFLADPRDAARELVAPVTHVTGKVGLGIMYRVLDVRRFFAAVGKASYGAQSVNIRFDIADSFVPGNAGTYTVAFSNGRANLIADEHAQVRIGLDIADFTSLILGAVTLEQLVVYRRATVSNEATISDIDSLFRVSHQPICLHPF